MTAKEIYWKTMKFNWLKLGLGLATIFIAAILLGMCMLLGMLFGQLGMLVMFLVWIAAVRVVHLFIQHYVGYLVKAGHVAIIAMAVTSGQVPEKQVQVAKDMVAQRFGTANIYFVLDKLVSGAVRQLQNALGRAGNALDFVPGMDAMVKVGKMFIGISLNYVDECCLGYTFYQKEQNAFKSAADGVVIYAQNGKRLLQDAAITTVVIIGSVIGVTLVVFLFFGGLFALLDWPAIVAFVLALLVALVIKVAFIDSWILVKMMSSYMEVAPGTRISLDLYQKLSDLSGKFKELLLKSEEQEDLSRFRNIEISAQAPNPTPITPAALFCGQCGTRQSANSKFCGHCGAGLGG